MKRTAAVCRRKGDADFIAGCGKLHVFCNDDKPGKVVLHRLNIGCKHFQVIQLGTADASNRCQVDVAFLCHILRGKRGICIRDIFYSRMLFQILPALIQCLDVGIDLRNIRNLCIGQAQQIVADAKRMFSDDIEIVPHAESSMCFAMMINRVKLFFTV